MTITGQGFLDTPELSCRLGHASSPPISSMSTTPALWLSSTTIQCRIPPPSQGGGRWDAPVAPGLYTLSIMINGQDAIIMDTKEKDSDDTDDDHADAALASFLSQIEIIPARVIASVAPRLGPTSGGTNVTIRGNKGILGNTGTEVLCWFGSVASQAMALIER